jgi:hypothetical protein
MDTPRRTPSAFQDGDSQKSTHHQQQQQQHSPPHPAPVHAPSSATQPKMPNKALEELEHEISQTTEWTGAFLRRVREAHGVSLEEVTHATKITKAYILAIEEENVAKLPAGVFIRGFVSQIARLLKLPHQQVAASYMTRLQRANPDKIR